MKLLLEHSPLKAIDPEHAQLRSTVIQQQGEHDVSCDTKQESDDVTEALWDSAPDDLWNS